MTRGGMPSKVVCVVAMVVVFLDPSRSYQTPMIQPFGQSYVDLCGEDHRFEVQHYDISQNLGGDAFSVGNCGYHHFSSVVVPS